MIKRVTHGYLHYAIQGDLVVTRISLMPPMDEWMIVPSQTSFFVAKPVPGVRHCNVPPCECLENAFGGQRHMYMAANAHLEAITGLGLFTALGGDTCAVYKRDQPEQFWQEFERYHERMSRVFQSYWK